MGSGGSLMFAWLKKALIWAAGAASLLLAVWMAGRRDQRQEDARIEADAYIKTRQEIDNVETYIRDPDAARKWLHERGQQ
jgi:hypothetical protein